MGKVSAIFMYLFCLTTAASFAEVAAEEQDECMEASCSKHGPAIRFPFLLRDKQPNHCGYPGFNLSCTDKKHTFLELPNSVKLYVTNIDYKSQPIHVYDPDMCLPRHLANFSLAASPFHFNDSQENYTLFHCESNKEVTRTFQAVPCLGSPGHQVYAAYSFALVGYTSLLSCTKLSDFLSVSTDVFHQPKDLLLNWSKPECANCAVERKRCRLKNNGTVLQTECYGILKSNKGARKKLVIIIPVIFGSLLLLLVAALLYFLDRKDRSEKEKQAKIDKFLDDYKALKPGRYSYADIKMMTNNFEEILGNGIYGPVFKRKLSSEITVAVKILNNSTGKGDAFVNEVRTTGQIHHVNVVRLFGYCADGFRRALVNEFQPNDSLQKFIVRLRGRVIFLAWRNFKILLLSLLARRNFKILLLA